MNIFTLRNGRRAAATLALLWLAAQAPAFAQSTAADSWPRIRESLFQNRPIDETADSVLEIDAPVRAEDAAIVPLAIRTRFDQTPGHYIDKLYLIIDNNPSPVAGVFKFSVDSGKADIETRVRIDAYTTVRAIAETNDGKLHMTSKFVKASGGCSAPPGKDQQAALASLGKMRMRVEGDVTSAHPVLAQLMISHPNDSGLAMDQLTRTYQRAHFVRKVDVTYGGKLVMSADVDISISENPNFRFYFVPHGSGELKAEVVDSDQLDFKSDLKVQPGSV